MRNELGANGVRVDSPQLVEGQGALYMPEASLDARTISEFFDLETPGISGFAMAILSERGGVHVDLCRSQEPGVTRDTFDWSLRALVAFMREHRIESVGVNTRGGVAGSLIGDDLEKVIEALKVLPRVSLEVVCHLNHERAFPFAPGVDRLALHRAFRNMDNLVGLDLRGEWDTAMVLDSVATCANIRSLAVRDMKMIDSELEYLTELKGLRRLELENGEIHGFGFRDLNAIPLESVFLSTQYITQSGFEALSDLQSLKEFGVRANSGTAGFEKLTVESIRPLGVLSNLTVLHCPDIHGNQVQLNTLAELVEDGSFGALRAVRGDW